MRAWGPGNGVKEPPRGPARPARPKAAAPGVSEAKPAPRRDLGAVGMAQTIDPTAGADHVAVSYTHLTLPTSDLV